MTEKQETTYSMEQRAKLWAVGGGKGGVGKSFLTTNIGVLLAKEGKRVVLMDLDLGERIFILASGSRIWIGECLTS